MRRVLLFLGVLVAASLITGVLIGQQKTPHPPKTYNVSLTREQWHSVINGLEAIKSSVKLSNMPASQSTYISDSLIAVYQVEFSRQVNLQLDAEKAKPEVKRDSINKNKKQ